MTIRTLIPFFAAAIVLSRTAYAQTVTLVATDPRRWDATLSVGWLGGDKSAVAEEWNDWYDAFATSVEAGRYWTPHLKTELAATFTSNGGVYSSEQIDVPGLPAPVFVSREHRYRVRAAHASVAYQFLENAWVHPFVAAGIQLAWERRRIESPFGFPFGPRGGPPVPAPAAEAGTEFDPRPFVSTGAKFYVTERGFVRTDLSAAFDGHGATRVWWRAGVGFDF